MFAPTNTAVAQGIITKAIENFQENIRVALE